MLLRCLGYSAQPMNVPSANLTTLSGAPQSQVAAISRSAASSTLISTTSLVVHPACRHFRYGPFLSARSSRDAPQRPHVSADGSSAFIVALRTSSLDCPATKRVASAFACAETEFVVSEESSAPRVLRWETDSSFAGSETETGCRADRSCSRLRFRATADIEAA